MRALTGFVAVALAASACGLGTSRMPTSTADCATQVRVRGVVYTAYAFTRHPATRYAPADRAECQDVGENPRGSVFPDDPRQVAAWSLTGYPPEKVLGVRSDRRSFEVLVAESVPQLEREAILDGLSHEGR